MSELARIHLDAVGGVAGDMFVAALADAFPERTAGLLAELGKLEWPQGATVRFAEHRGDALKGQRFLVEAPQGHQHAAWRDIRAMLQASPLAAGTKAHALGIFARLAEAEGTVHGIAPEEVGFHEIGAWDSIIDIVGAAWLIDALSPRRWTWSPLPIGGGRAKTVHGVLPLPAPAAVLLLRGMPTIDDGVPGERVTPTGAAILRYLAETPAAGEEPFACSIAATGIGFGARRIEELPNILRCIAYAEVPVGAARDESIATLQFEIDDQSAEDLGLALERIRATAGVLELYQAPVYAKKGRLATQVQILARRDAADAIAQACFEQTTTLGLRIGEMRRRVLAREVVSASGMRVKVAQRPSGEWTAKAESDDVAQAAAGRKARDRARRAAEDSALEAGKNDGKQRRN